jgi:hypothetical protein
MLAAWIDFASTSDSVQDPLREAVLAARSLEGRERTVELLALIDPVLAQDAEVVYRVDSLLGSFAID